MFVFSFLSSARTSVGLVEQICQVDHTPLDGRNPLDDELWLVVAAGLHIHVHLVHIHLVLHALLNTHRHMSLALWFSPDHQ